MDFPRGRDYGVHFRFPSYVVRNKINDGILICRFCGSSKCEDAKNKPELRWSTLNQEDHSPETGEPCTSFKTACKRYGIRGIDLGMTRPIMVVRPTTVRDERDRKAHSKAGFEDGQAAKLTMEDHLMTEWWTAMKVFQEIGFMLNVGYNWDKGAVEVQKTATASGIEIRAMGHYPEARQDLTSAETERVPLWKTETTMIKNILLNK